MNLKSVLIGGAAVGALAIAAPAHAGTYISVFGGINSLEGDELAFGPFTYSALAFSSPWNSGSPFIWMEMGTPNGSFGFPYGGSRHSSGSGSVYAHTYAGGFSEDSFDSGFVFGVALGMDFHDGWRAELEIAWRRNDMGENHLLSGTHSRTSAWNTFISVTGFAKHYTTGGSWIGSNSYTVSNPLIITKTTNHQFAQPFTATATTSGEVTSFAVMANLWFDYDLGEDYPITPFVGAGIGAVNLKVDYSGRAILPTNTAFYLTGYGTFQNTATFATDADDWTWAWQAAAGLAYELGNGMSISAQYRYFATGDITVAGQDFGVSSHEGLIGLTIPFGQ